MKLFSASALLFSALFTFQALHAQTPLTNKKDGGYKFEVIKAIDATDVQNQNRTGTCWSFSALSFYESELIRLGKGKINLSEMYVVRKAYEAKADFFVRFNGKHNFGPGGAFHDIPYVLERFGIVPEELYKGLNYGDDKHNHAELDAMLEAMMQVVVKNPQKKLTPAWRKAVAGVLDAYLGAEPEKFTYQGKEYTPQSYAKSLGLNMGDYISITSFTHHPFYTQFALEIPDNWNLGRSYNVPLNEFTAIMEHAVTNGFGIAWGADVSEKGFSFRDGLAIVPEDESTILKKGEDSKHFNDAGAVKVSSAFDAPVKEKTITQEMRQAAFDSYETTDDHGMHITGLVKDQNGNKYFFVKNSWGKANDCDGYFFASMPYVQFKTINFIVHKDGIPKDIKNKLGIK
ncbi:MAG: C1 family peptidase [Flavobacteriales bacterium]|nr:C1 family peptidase [Flavobacteriales bacterium]